MIHNSLTIKYENFLCITQNKKYNKDEKVMQKCTVFAKKKKKRKILFVFLSMKEKKKSLLCLAYDIYYSHLEFPNRWIRFAAFRKIIHIIPILE